MAPRAPLLTVLAVVLLAGCARRPSAPACERPRCRTAGERAPAFVGGDPAQKGWVKADDGLLWVEARDAEAFRAGRLRLGDGTVPFAEADRVPKSADGGYALRTDHLLLRTNVAFARARELAALAEAHVARVLEVYGPALDLRLPEDPLRLVVASRRAEFGRLLQQKVADPVEWGAFYDAKDGVVYASDEPLGQGGVGVVADLRHELTHAILDLGRPEAGRARMFLRPHFWIWEGSALYAEGLGDPAGARAGSERFARFQRRLAWGEAVPLATLLALGQDAFVGRHYDQTASFMLWLLDGDGGARRAPTLALLSRVMDGDGATGDFERILGMSAQDAEARWLASLGHGTATPPATPPVGIPGGTATK